MTLTANDLRVLIAVRDACAEYDGFAPHTSSDWIAARRLLRGNLVEILPEFGACMTCPTMHEGPVYRITAAGRRALTDEADRMQSRTRRKGAGR